MVFGWREMEERGVEGRDFNKTFLFDSISKKGWIGNGGEPNPSFNFCSPPILGRFGGEDKSFKTF